MAAYCGLMPSVYQLAGKLITGHITKHGSPYVRRMLLEAAHAISRTSRTKAVFSELMAGMEPKAAIVSLARKVICILHQLVVNREMFEDKATNKSKLNKPGRSFSSPEPTIADAIQILGRAGYAVQKRSEPEEE